MQKFKLTLEQREVIKPNQLRVKGKIPATIYGPGKESQNVQVCAKEFSKLPAAAYSHILELDGNKGGTQSAIIRHVQRKATTHQVLNIEFYLTATDRKLTVSVPLKFIGSSPAVQLGGQLIEIHQEAEIECFPQDIPDFLEIDISTLVEVEQGIHFGELQVPAAIKILNPHEEIIVRVVPKRVEVEEAKPAAAAEGAAPADAAAAPAPSAEK